jgi:hypothetical protein
MVTPALLEGVIKRAIQVRSSTESFGGIAAVLLIADFTQLPPGMGGVAAGLLPKILDHSSSNNLGAQLRTFQRTVLSEQERGRECPWQIELVAKMRDTTTNIFPLTNELLAESCDSCERADEPTNECRHLHVLRARDIIRDPTWG